MDDMQKTVEKLQRIADKLKSDNDKQTAIVEEFNKKEKTKALSTNERLDRLERIKGIK